MMENLSTDKKHWKKSVVKYNKNCDRVCTDVRAPCSIALTIIY